MDYIQKVIFFEVISNQKIKNFIIRMAQDTVDRALLGLNIICSYVVFLVIFNKMKLRMLLN